MRKQQFFAAAGGGAALAAGYLARRYHHDFDAARTRLAAVGARVIMTEFGAVEYAESGSGEPVVVLHGIFGGCDAGLAWVRGLVSDRRVIALSRFGYLGSSLPPGATPADQADAYAALLDTLKIDRTDVLAFSAGATSALQFALRHPDRIKHLVVVSGNLPGNQIPARLAPIVRLTARGDLVLWAMWTFAWPLTLRLVGVPKGYRLTAEDERFVHEVKDITFPVRPRAEGVIFDFFTSNPDVHGYELEAIKVPALIVHSEDDPLISYEAARRAASRIPAPAWSALSKAATSGSAIRRSPAGNSPRSWERQPRHSA